MLKSLLDRMAELLDPGPELHAGDDFHALGQEGYEDEDGIGEW
jgi:hypothetical protein